MSGSRGCGEADGGAWAVAAHRSDPETEAAFADLIMALRALQDATAGARPPAKVARGVALTLRQAAEALVHHSVGEAEQFAGRLYRLPGRAQALIPAVTFEKLTDSSVVATVKFGRYYLGSDGAVFGGALPLLFDELLGVLMRMGNRPKALTAFLNVNFRAATPIDRTLTGTASLTKQEGRKLYVTGSLHDGEKLVADAEALFVTLATDH